MFHRVRFLSVVLCAAVVCPLVSKASEPLPKDPNNIYGQYNNGLKYIIRQHANPPGRVAVYLHVKTGALNENENQNGLAHFLEHLGFNGGKHFAPGELIPYMSTMGMTFGAHSNAHTSQNETVYKLFMPDTKDDTVETALKVMSDFADGMLLLQKEVDAERGVILEEARSRKSARERIQKEYMKNVFAGTRLAVHDVIGKEDQIETFPKAEFDDYWNTWYRPENMTLIIVGDIDTQKIIAQAKPFLGTFAARAPARKPKNGEVKAITKPRAFVLTDPEQIRGEVEVIAVNPGRPAVKSFEDYRARQIERIGTSIVNRRLDELVQKGDAKFRRAFCFVRDLHQEAVLPFAMASGESEDWNAMLEQTIIELSRAIEHGFTERELDLVKEGQLARAEQAVEREKTRDARRLISSISRAIGMESPILSAEQRLELTRRVLAGVSLTEVQQVFLGHFKTRNFTYVVKLPEAKEGATLPTSKDVLAAASAAWARKTAPVDDVEKIDSILAKLPTPGKVVSQSTDPDLQITTATLSNGAIVHHFFSDYKKDEATINITFAGGSIEETAQNRGVSSVASLVGATSRMSSTQIRDFMTGKNVRVFGGVGLDTATIRISGSPEDLEVGLQLAFAYMTDGKIEQSALDNWKKASLQRLEARKTSARGQLSMAMDDKFYANDVRLVALTPEQIGKLTVKQGEQWNKRIVDTAAIEVAVVGEIKLDRALELVGRYVGSLPQRSLGAAESLNELRKLDRGPGPYTKVVRFDTITDQASVRAGFVGAEQSNVRDTRMLSLATRILSERMIKRIREEESIVYGIRCSSRPAVAIPGTGTIAAGTTTKPENAEKLADLIIEMLEDFAANGPSAEEVTVAKKQIANNFEQRMKEPRFWLGQIEDMNYRGRTLAQLKEIPAVYQTFTAAELQAVAQKYMTKDRLFRFVAMPKTTARLSSPKSGTPTPTKKAPGAKRSGQRSR
ncbi:MAG: insulinase family protein [Planctomycetes bacterium]|nr:insulinase family protein [Planctomycetota bacterium]